MNRRILARNAALGLAAALAATPTTAAPPSASASPAGSTAPPASAAPAAVTPPRPIAGADIPAQASNAPDAREWAAGRSVAPTRGRAERCELTLVREWLRVRCPGMGGVGLVAGDPKDVRVRVLGLPFTDDGMPGNLAATVVLPIRRGEARLVSFDHLENEYDSTTLGESGVLSVVWRHQRADPVVGMYGLYGLSGPTPFGPPGF